MSWQKGQQMVCRGPKDSTEDERMRRTPLPEEDQVTEGKGQGSMESLTRRSIRPHPPGCEGARARVGWERLLGAGVLRGPSPEGKGEGSPEALLPGDAQQEGPPGGEKRGDPPALGGAHGAPGVRLDRVRPAPPPRTRGGEAEPTVPRREPARGSPGPRGRRGGQRRINFPPRGPHRRGGRGAPGPGAAGMPGPGGGRRRPPSAAPPPRWARPPPAGPRPSG